MKVRKAVIVAAGWGTRMLPASRVIPKELLPVVDTPAIQVIVEEIAASGIDDIAIVISPGRTLVLDQFRPAPELEQYLEERGKRDLLAIVQGQQQTRANHADRAGRAAGARPRGDAGARFRRRRADRGAPARRYRRRSAPVPGTDPRRLPSIATRPRFRCSRCRRSELSKYGIVEVNRGVEDRLYRLTGMVEKPRPENAPSDFAIIGRYVLTPEIFDLLRDTPTRSRRRDSAHRRIARTLQAPRGLWLRVRGHSLRPGRPRRLSDRANRPRLETARSR